MKSTVIRAFTLPRELDDALKASIPKGERSRVVSEAIRVALITSGGEGGR
ncbi:MAG: hypothetical protein HYU39_02255 [Thaumarchaeota archaeon]|nr:hypothetical protein [Nitrososphaerota archaeon]